MVTPPLLPPLSTCMVKLCQSTVSCDSASCWQALCVTIVARASWGVKGVELGHSNDY